MDKKKLTLGINLGALISSAIVFLSVFLDFVSTKMLGVKISATGLDYLKNGEGYQKFYTVMLMILAIAVIALALLRLLNKLNTKMFSIIFVAVGALLLLFALMIFFDIDEHRGIGLILNFIFAIIAAGCCVTSFFIKE